MKSVDPGILPQSHCSTFQPSENAKKSLIYMTWCGHYFCTREYYMSRETYPYNLLLFVRRGGDGRALPRGGIRGAEG